MCAKNFALRQFYESLRHLLAGVTLKVYELRAAADADGDLISFGGDKSHRLTSYFVWNEGDGRFLKFVKPSAKAQDFLTLDKITKTDFLEDDLGIPILSIDAAEVLSKRIPDEVEFWPLTINVHGKEMEFRLCKAKIYTSLVDEANSSYRSMTDGSSIITHRVYYSTFPTEFHIARDKKYDGSCVVSQSFVDICVEHNLKIAFFELPQSASAAPSN